VLRFPQIVLALIKPELFVVTQDCASVGKDGET
jgi:hypothetical protein